MGKEKDTGRFTTKFETKKVENRCLLVFVGEFSIFTKTRSNERSMAIREKCASPRLLRICYIAPLGVGSLSRCTGVTVVSAKLRGSF